MRLTVQVKAGMHRDHLWRDAHGLVAHIRAAPTDGQANAYLVRYLAGSLRVAQSRVTIKSGHTSRHKLIEVRASEADLRPILDALPPVPQAGLFDSE
jgi:uncharacterized protein YggU (UPF0235/DUF167 family)